MVCLDAESDRQQTAHDQESKGIIKEMTGLVEVYTPVTQFTS